MAFSSPPSLRWRCPNPRAEPGSLSGFCSRCPHWKKYSNWFYWASEPVPPVQRGVTIQNVLWRTIMGITMGFISQRTIRVDAVSRYHRLLGDLVCLDQADLLLPSPLWERGFQARSWSCAHLGVCWVSSGTFVSFHIYGSSEFYTDPEFISGFFYNSEVYTFFFL